MNRRQLGLVILSLILVWLAIGLTAGHVVYPWHPYFLVMSLLVVLGLTLMAVRVSNPMRRWGVSLQIGALWLLNFVLLATFPPVPDMKGKEKRAHCISNLKQQAMGLLMYAEESDNRFPRAESWHAASMPDTNMEFRCPLAKTPWSYAMNARASSLLVPTIDGLPSGPVALVLLFEADAAKPDASGGPDGLVFRHQGTTSIGYADGHARANTKEQAARLSWNP